MEERRSMCLFLWQINASHPPHIVVKPRRIQAARRDMKEKLQLWQIPSQRSQYLAASKEMSAERARGIAIMTADRIQSNMSVWLADNKMRKTTAQMKQPLVSFDISKAMSNETEIGKNKLKKIYTRERNKNEKVRRKTKHMLTPVEFKSNC